MSRICRTCLSEIPSKHYIDLKRFPFAKKQLMLCVPELDFDVALDSIICMTCARALYAAYKFKICCLRTEQRIHSYIQMLTIQQDNLELVPGNNDNTINLTEMFLVHDFTNEYNAADNHLKTSCNLEDVKEECMSDATDENCDEVDENYEGIKEESMEIEETELDDFIKSEVLDSCSDTGVKFSLEQWSQFENATNQMQDVLSENHVVDKSQNCEPILLRLDISENIPNNNEQMLKNDECEATNSMEIQRGIDCLDLKANIKENDVSSSGIKMEFERQSSTTVMQSEGLVEQKSKSNYGEYIVNIESSNSSVICAQSCSKQDNSVTKTPETVNRLESKDNFTTATWQQKINARIIAETSNNNSLKDIVKHKSTTKSHSKNDKRRPYRLHKNKKNSNEPIVGTSALHIDTIAEKPYKCNVCDYASFQKGNLKAHLRGHTGEKPHRCNSCDYASSRKGDLDVHMAKHTGEKPCKCNSCDYASSRKGDLDVHMAKHTGEKPYKCNSCDYASSWKNSLKLHVRSHTGEKPYKCNVCEYASFRKGNLKVHLMGHTGEKPYKCNVCDYANFRKSSLNAHLICHTGEKPYNCNSCDYASSWKSSLKLHVRSHNGEKPYKCNSCDYASSVKANLKIHMSKHTGEKPYKCNFCDYASSVKANLKIHTAKHTGEKPYKCNSCDYASSMKANLKIHMAKHTGKKPYKCNSCDYASSMKANLKIHMAKHTGEMPYKCNSCDYASSWKGNLKKHMSKHTEGAI